MADSRLLILQLRNTNTEDEVLARIQDLIEDNQVKVLAGTIVRSEDTSG